MAKSLSFYFVPLLCFFSALAAWPAPLALVYAGPGACEENCALAAGAVANRAGLAVKFVEPDEITGALLKQAVVWIQPGGNAITLAKTLAGPRMELLRAFVRNGGGYLGFCAGAFFTDTSVDDGDTIPGLGIIPGSTWDYRKSEKTAILPIDWNGTKRFLYFEEGGYFTLPENSGARVLAHYATGEIAALVVAYGKGMVAVSGPHPEAIPEWLEGRGLVDPDGPDYDLAAQMLSYAIRK